MKNNYFSPLQSYHRPIKEVMQALEFIRKVRTVLNKGGFFNCYTKKQLITVNPVRICILLGLIGLS